MRTLTVFVVIFLFVSPGVFGDLVYSTGGLEEYNQDKGRPEPYASDGLIRYVRGYDIHSVPNISVSAGVQAISYGLGAEKFSDGFQLVKSLTPVQMNFPILQFVQIEWLAHVSRTGDIEFSRTISTQQTWAIAAGITISTESGQKFPIGFSFIPYEFIRKEYSVGVGIQWLSIGDSFFDRHNFSIVIPFTYSFSVTE